MVKSIRPPGDRDFTKFLRLLFLRAERDIVREITRKRTKGLIDYHDIASLDRVQATLQGMVDESWEYVPQMVERIFYQTAKDLAGYQSAQAQTSLQNYAIQQLSNNLLGEIIESASTAMESARDLFHIGRIQSGIIRTATLNRMALQEATGYGSLKSSAKLTQELENHGITAFVDRAGRRWGLSDYCNMALRTTARQAEVSAILTADPDHDLYQILAVGTTCPVCAPLENRVYSRSGNNKDYPPLAAAYGKVDPGGSDDLTNTYLTIHPNCVHPLVKYTTTGKIEQRIQADKDFSSFTKNPPTVDPRSEAQVKAYKEKTKARQKLLDDIKQYRKYQVVLGDRVPKTFKTFQKHKLLKSNDYKKWQYAYRQENKRIKEILAGGEQK